MKVSKVSGVSGVSGFGLWELFATIAIVGFLAACLAPKAWATAATAEVDTPARDGSLVALTQGSNVIYAGTLVVLNSSGLAEHATDAASKKVVGRAEKTQDNTGSNYSATRTINVRRGVFRWTNGDTFTDANIGDFAYVEDNQTVQKAASASQDIVGGVIVDVDTDGVWVDTYAIGGQGAASFTTVAASGAITGSSTLDTAADITVTDADGAAKIVGIGYEGNDATLVLDADQGDDNADTWTIESEAADNDLSFVNHTTEQFKITSAGDAKSTGDLHALGGDIYLGTVGNFSVVNTTQLVFIASGVTNVVDADITH